MGRWLRRLAVLTGLLAIVVAGWGQAGSAAARSAAADPPTTVGGVQLPFLPAGLGDPTDFAYDYDGVDFASRVWEARLTESAYGVDLDVTVMRGARLRTGTALRRWFVAYEQRDPEPAYVPVSVHGRPGWRCRDQLFWLVRPGLAVSVQLDVRRFPARDVERIARAARPPRQ